MSGVKTYFEQKAKYFDLNYEVDKSAFRRFVDIHLRKSIQLRFEQVFQLCWPLAGNSFLDVGCGSGRYCVHAAELGATRVLGLDFSNAMLEEAAKLKEQLEFQDVVEYRNMDITKMDLEERFDFSISIGVTEYIKDPVTLISRIADFTKKKMIISFPVKFHPLTPQRWVRYRLNNCYLKFYTTETIERIMPKEGKLEIQKLQRDYLAVWSPE